MSIMARIMEVIVSSRVSSEKEEVVGHKLMASHNN